MKIKELLLLCGCLALLTFFITDTIRRQKGNQDRIRKEAYDFGEKAANAGTSSESNPYIGRDRVRSEQWLKGWMNANDKDRI